MNGKMSVFLLPFFLLFLPPAGAEVIHGGIVAVTSLGNGGPPSSPMPLRLEDLWGLRLEEDRDLLRGVEIQIDLPEEADLYRGTYAVFAWAGVAPPPARDIPSYQGSQLFFKVVDGGKKLFLQLPFGSSAGFGPIPDTYVHKKALGEADFPLLFAVMPIMKGIPDRASGAVFSTQVRPIFKNLGKLVVVPVDETGPLPEDDFRLFIDDKPHPFDRRGFNIEPGMHRLRMEKDGYAPFVSTVGLDRGRVSRVEAFFRKNASFLRINAPTGSRVFLDGRSVEPGGKDMTVEPGEHTLSMKIGDYQTNKKFLVEPGKSYGISLFLDILINED